MMRSSFAASLLVLTTACASTQDNGRACTEIGCADGLLVQVTPTSAWPHGEYRFTIETDGATTVTCTGTLPLPECGTSALTCDGTGVTIGESGCALPAAEHAFSDIMFMSSPAAVQISVELDGQPVGSQSYTPRYETMQPNGPECEPTCRNASESLALTFP